MIPSDTTSFLPFFGTDIGLCSVIKPQVRVVIHNQVPHTNHESSLDYMTIRVLQKGHFSTKKPSETRHVNIWPIRNHFKPKRYQNFSVGGRTSLFKIGIFSHEPRTANSAFSLPPPQQPAFRHSKAQTLPPRPEESTRLPEAPCWTELALLRP